MPFPIRDTITPRQKTRPAIKSLIKMKLIAIVAFLYALAIRYKLTEPNTGNPVADAQLT